MPEAVSALNGKAATGSVGLRDLGPRGMITLRGDLGNAALQQVCTELTGAGFPAPRTIQMNGDAGLGWMSPDEVLVMVPYDGVAAALARLTGALSEQHHLAVDVSDARAVIEVQGAAAREVLAKLTPADMHPAAFPVGQFRRSRLGQIAAAFWMQDEMTIVVICFRSVADYAFALLSQSAKDGAVGFFPSN